MRQGTKIQQKIVSDTRLKIKPLFLNPYGLLCRPALKKMKKKKTVGNKAAFLESLSAFLYPTEQDLFFFGKKNKKTVENKAAFLVSLSAFSVGYELRLYVSERRGSRGQNVAPRRKFKP